MAVAKALSLVFGGDVVKVKDYSHLVLQLDGKLYDIMGDVTELYTVDKIMSDQDIENEDYMNNYSFDIRGPII